MVKMKGGDKLTNVALQGIPKQALGNSLRAICEICGIIFDVEPSYMRVNHHYCYSCKEALRIERNTVEYRERRKVVVKEEMPLIKRKPMCKFLTQHECWYNAGLYCGKQGLLRDKFQKLLDSGLEFLEAKQILEIDPKWQAEIKGLTDVQRRAWLIGFMVSFNGGS